MKYAIVSSEVDGSAVIGAIRSFSLEKIISNSVDISAIRDGLFSQLGVIP